MSRTSERRVHTRLPCLADVTIEGSATPVEGTLRDISLGGARVTISHKDYPEPPLTLAIPSGGETLRFAVEQVRRQGRDDEVVLGFRFIDADRPTLERLVNHLRPD